MAAFHFRLQTLLNVKEQLEKGIKNDLGIAIQKMEQQKQILLRIQQEIINQENAYRKEGASKTTLVNLKQRIAYIKVMRNKEIEQRERVNEEARNVDKIRERLIEMMKEKKVLEKLREKELALFKEEQNRAEQLIVDELVSFKESIKTEDT